VTLAPLMFALSTSVMVSAGSMIVAEAFSV